MSRRIGTVLGSKISFNLQQFYLRFKCEHKTINFCSNLYRFVFLKQLFEVFLYIFFNTSQQFKTVYSLIYVQCQILLCLCQYEQFVLF